MTGVDRAAGAEPGDSERAHAERKARAWSLWNHDRKSVQGVATEMGVSKSTAHRWIMEGEAAEVYAGLLDRQRRRVAMADRIRLYAEIALEEWRQGGSAGGNRKAGAGSFRDLIPHLATLERLEMDLMGLKTPTQVEHSFVEKHGEAPPPFIVDAVQAAKERDAEKRRAIEGGDGL